MCIRLQFKKTNVPALHSIKWLSVPSFSPLDNDVIYILVLNFQLNYPKRDNNKARFACPRSKQKDSRI